MTNSNYPWGSAAFAVTNPDRAKFFATISGRERWVLKCLAAAGETGCIPLKHPRPRWAAYVHDLCRKGSVIETVKERDGESSSVKAAGRVEPDRALRVLRDVRSGFRAATYLESMIVSGLEYAQGELLMHANRSEGPSG